MQTATKKELNKSGIVPCGNHILIRPDPIDEKVGLIDIPAEVRKRHQQSIAYGCLVAVGPDCFTHAVEETHRLINDRWVPVERKVTKYSEPFAQVGDRISFAIYQGRAVMGEDGELYVQMNDTDITSRISEKIVATSLAGRDPFSFSE